MELAIAQWTWPSIWMWLLGSIVAGITACYSVRLLSYIYLGNPSGPKKTYESSSEQPMAIVIPIVILSILAIGFGYFARDAIVGMGIPSGAFISASNLVTPTSATLLKEGAIISTETVVAEFGLSPIKKNLPLICTLTGIIVGLVYFVHFVKGASKLKSNEMKNTAFALIAFAGPIQSTKERKWSGSFILSVQALMSLKI